MLLASGGRFPRRSEDRLELQTLGAMVESAVGSWQHVAPWSTLSFTKMAIPWRLIYPWLQRFRRTYINPHPKARTPLISTPKHTPILEAGNMSALTQAAVHRSLLLWDIVREGRSVEGLRDLNRAKRLKVWDGRGGLFVFNT